MIAKRIAREKGTSSPARLVKYMVAAQGQIDPQTWARTADYILATDDKTYKGEKVGSYRVTNCMTDDPAAATVLIEATQALNTRSKSDKTYHLVFSFPPGEEPNLDILHEIEDDLVSSIGYADHQRISAVHVDTDHLHVHVAINKVHPTGLQNIEPYFDKKRLMEACERLEIKYDLQRTSHGLEKQNHERTRNNDRSRTERIELNPAERPELRDTAFRRYLRESYNLTFANEPEAKTLNNLRTLSSRSLANAHQRNQMLLQSDALASVEQGGRKPDSSVRRAGTSNRAIVSTNGGRIDAYSPQQAAELGAFQETALTENDALKARDITGKAADIEKHSGVETLTGYVAREVAPAIRAATNWQEVHTALAEHGLLMTQRGAGLIVGDPELPLWTKASSCSRDLSLKAMTDRLGPFEKSKATAKAKKTFEPKPRQNHPASAELFSQYQRERQNSTTGRRAAFNNLKAENAKFNAELKSWTKQQRALLKLSGKGATKKIMSSMITQQASASREKHRQAMAQKREQLFKQAPMKTWAEWLCSQAEAGNIDALEILRTREERELRFKTDLLTAESAERAKTYIMKALKPYARNDGSMTYKTADGGLVVDRATHVKAEKATTGAALVALELASKRFNGQALIVEGSDTFKNEVAKLAALHKLDIRFADPEMERARQEAWSEAEAIKVSQPQVESFNKLVDHGAAPFENDHKKRDSYFVTIENANGDQRTVWGVDLERAVNESGAEIGDSVKLDHVQSEPVRLPNGKTVSRNKWAVEIAPKDKVLEPTTAATEQNQNVVNYINERNKMRDKLSSIDYHKLWSESDAGAVTYQGRRKMKDGSEVLLLKRGDVILVKPSSARVVAKAAKWKVGSTVQIDARGRFVSDQKTKSNGISL